MKQNFSIISILPITHVISAMIQVLARQLGGATLSIDADRLEVLINAATEKHQKVWLLVNQIKHLTWGEISHLLSLLDNVGFGKLAIGKRNFTVEKKCCKFSTT